MTEYNRREQARIEKLQGQVETLRELRDLDRAEIERLNIRIRQDAEAALQHLNEIDELTGSKAALQAEIERLRLICDDTVRHLEEAEAEIEPLQMALIKATAVIAQLQRERHTTKQMLKDVLDKHGYSGWDAARTLTDD